MFSTHSFSRLVSRRALSGVALLGIAGVAFAFVCRSGSGGGDWDLPAGSGTPGYLSGELFESSGPLPAFFFGATLTDVSTPCLSCVQGTIDGLLDDGFGPAPDYIVTGEYHGLFLNGTGTFECRVFRPGSDVSVGKITGRFLDPPAQPGPGQFTARWEICP